jgi:two-component system sensor kinase FixL
MIEISVTDTGHGIAPEVGAQLFQPFVTSKPQGMGVGLSISRTIIEAHGGTIGPRPNPGGGTIFSFTLPAVAKEDVGNAV